MIYGNRLGHSDSILVSQDSGPLSMQKVGPRELTWDMFRGEARRGDNTCQPKNRYRALGGRAECTGAIDKGVRQITHRR
jgi:hypothetical protein